MDTNNSTPGNTAHQDQHKAETQQAAHTTATETDKQGSEPRHGADSIHNNALHAASMGRSATEAVDPHNNSGLTDTGTNVSYENPQAGTEEG